METRTVGEIVVGGVVGVLFLFVVIMLATGTKTVNTPEGISQYSDYEQILINRAKEIYLNKQKQSMNFQNGPCLDENLDKLWVVDLVHQPRRDEDNLPANQCQRFLNGEADHFIELDLDGNLIRLK